jgi:serine protease inhibitor
MIRSELPNLNPPTEINLKFDRPFAFMIRHRVTNELLFVGKINNL